MWAAVKFGMLVPIETIIWDALKGVFQKNEKKKKDGKDSNSDVSAKKNIETESQHAAKQTSRFRPFARRRASKHPDVEKRGSG